MADNPKRPDLIAQTLAWSLSLAVAVIAFVAWGQGNGWQLGHLSPYQLFPLLGLLAFSLMWSHYVSGTARELIGAGSKVLSRYYAVTGWAVLILICLHPGLLIYQRFRDGFGLPPGSYETYVTPSLKWLTLLGTASLLVFLAFELHRWYGKKPWWHFVQEAGDVAMLAIFYHSLRLGSQLHQGSWLMKVWWFYGVTLVAVLVRSYYLKYFKPEQKPAG